MECPGAGSDPGQGPVRRIVKIAWMFMMRSGSSSRRGRGEDGWEEVEKNHTTSMSICESCPKKLLAIEGDGRGGKTEETSSSCLVLQRWSQQQEMAEVLWGRSSSRSKRQRKLLNEIFALKFCQVSCARLPSVRTSWLRSASRSSSSRGSSRGGSEAAVYRSTPTHSRTSVLSRSPVTDSNSRAGAGKYH